MATIYLARQVSFSGFGQSAAVKVIHPHLAEDRDFVGMFLDEARVVSCINHPNVFVECSTSARQAGTYYLAMEYVMVRDLERGFALAQAGARDQGDDSLPGHLRDGASLRGNARGARGARPRGQAARSCIGTCLRRT